MKKWIISLTVLLLLLFIGLPYFLISKTLLISNVVKVNRNSTSAARSLLKESDWQKWWPSGEMTEDGRSLDYKGYNYKITEHFYNAVGVDILKGKERRQTRINILPVNADSVFVIWEYQIHTSLNPFSRIKEYREAVASRQVMQDIMLHMKDFLDKTENVYGTDIHVSISKDSTLITTKFKTRDYPTTEEIYHSIAALKTYIHNNKAEENNFPMLRVEKHNDYETMVAIPVNKQLASKGEFVFKRFVPWKILVANVQGGDSAISQAFKEFEIYIRDYSLHEMANSFQSLVTDRSLEKDSSKWITQLVTPIP
ncbi:MAG: hypothetical protein Q8918_13255 [Bacteroidota bacterium]|nr:hypothetical protein [Bacteroidota bacterium]MDP4251071.1 hypothetical protein [Bacteroidota bacterium]